VAKTSGGPAERRHTPISESRADSAMAAMIVGLIVLSALCMVLYMLGTAGGWLVADGRLTSLGLTIYFVPWIALPLGVILMVVVLIRIGIRRRRQSKQV